MTAGLSLRGVTRTYGTVEALAGVDLDVAGGELFCLLGPSGSGKTTLLRLVAGFEPPDAGGIAIAGKAMERVPPERRGIGVVFQDYALFPHRSVADNVGFGLRMRKVGRPERQARVAEMLDLVGLGDVAGRRPGTLSGGQRQRVALARALAPSPSLLLLDEPLANLDRRLRESLRQELRRVHDRVGVTTVLVTHDQEEALTLADRIGIMRDGVLEQVGTPDELWRQPASRFVAGFLGEMNLLPATALGDGRATVPSLAAELPAMGSEGIGNGLVACVRPEALVVLPPGTGVDGRMESVAYAGGSATYRVVLAGGEAVIVREPLPDGASRWSAGDEVGVSALSVACRLLPA